MKSKIENARKALETLVIYAAEGGLSDKEIDIVFDAYDDITAAFDAFGSNDFEVCRGVVVNEKALRDFGLSNGALHLLLCMGAESKGKVDFEFSRTVAMEYNIPAASFRRYVSELIAKGYIQRNSGRPFGATNIYRLTK